MLTVLSTVAIGAAIFAFLVIVFLMAKEMPIFTSLLMLLMSLGE